MRARFTLFFLLSACSSLHAQDFSALDAAAGKALFERNWVTAPASTAATDGLGPYYNARSCAACHRDAGAGELTLAAMNLVVDDDIYGELLQLRAVPGMKPEVQAELMHTQGETFMLNGGAGITLSQPALALGSLQFEQDAAALAASVSLRRAPALHGLALLDEVPLAQLQAHADPDDSNGDGISGKVAQGRFGWRASAATLREQVTRAFSRDLGLSTPEFPAAAGDCTPKQHACLQAARAVTGDAFEAPATVIDLLLAYLKTLPPPKAPAQAGAGAVLFAELGCRACHVPQLQAAEQQLQPYTDLLLHDLGLGLATGGNPEWRTAPLWGLGQNPYFLHDGRARSLEEALLWHGGEAAASSAAYRNLNPGQRGVLHAWLLGL